MPGKFSSGAGYVSDAAFLAAGGISAGKHGLKALAKRGIKIDAVHYKRAGGGGIRILKDGKRFISFDHHQWGKTTKNIITKTHIDGKGFRHWPWTYWPWKKWF